MSSNVQATLAEKALTAAIDEATTLIRTDLTAQLGKEKLRVGELERAIKQMQGIAENVLRMVAPQAALPLAPVPVAIPEVQPAPVVDTGPAAQIAEEDDMGEGVWV